MKIIQTIKQRITQLKETENQQPRRPGATTTTTPATSVVERARRLRQVEDTPPCAIPTPGGAAVIPSPGVLRFFLPLDQNYVDSNGTTWKLGTGAWGTDVPVVHTNVKPFASAKGSMYFNRRGLLLDPRVDWRIAGAFTVRGWVRFQHDPGQDYHDFLSFSNWQSGFVVQWRGYTVMENGGEFIGSWYPAYHQWYYFCVTRDASNVVRVHFDGVLRGQVNASGGGPSVDPPLS